jgi:hypothetical protein
MTMWRFVALLLLIDLTAGCDFIDPYTRPGVWHPNGANDVNLRAMVVVPSDLAVAAPSASGSGALAAAALTRLRQDRVRPLPDSGIAQIVPVSGGAAPSAAAAPASGTGQ